MTTSEAYKILNLIPSTKVTKEDVKKAYIKIQKKIQFLGMDLSRAVKLYFI